MIRVTLVQVDEVAKVDGLRREALHRELGPNPTLAAVLRCESLFPRDRFYLAFWGADLPASVLAALGHTGPKALRDARGEANTRWWKAFTGLPIPDQYDAQEAEERRQIARLLAIIDPPEGQQLLPFGGAE